MTDGASPSPSPTRAPGHIAALDGLRALAVTAVILFHASTRIIHAQTSAANVAYGRLASAGWVGVDLFFVLSGFLITGILLDAKAKPRFFRNFYIRRTLRIFPLYYAVLIAVLVVGPLLLPTSDPGVQRILHHQAWLWTYTQNIDVLLNNGRLYDAGWIHLTHLWSLAIEEQFYLVWPLLVFVLPRRGLVGVALGLVIAAPILRAVMWHGGVDPWAIYAFTPGRLDTLAVGALLAVLVRARPADALRVGRILIAVGGAAVVAIVAITHRLDAEEAPVVIAGFSALALLFGGVIVVATRTHGRVARALSGAGLRAIGRYSYGIYIFHYLLLPVFERLYDVDAVAAHVGLVVATIGYTLVTFAITIAVAALSWWLFESRLLVLKDRWAPTTARAVPPAP